MQGDAEPEDPASAAQEELENENEQSGDEQAHEESLPRSGSSKKRKGKSTRWNIPAHALQILEQVFQKDKFPTVETRKNLSTDLKVTPRQVQVWFQNKRQRSVKPPVKASAEAQQQPHEILNTSEDIRAALMNFGSGSIEATRPQHEVFASEDKVVHLNGASNSSASSAAAEAWMAAAMHATQMQPSNSHCSMDQTCGRQAADPMAQGGMNSWWRSSSGGYPSMPYSSNSRSTGQWQMPVQQGSCGQSNTEQSRGYVQLPQMVHMLSRVGQGGSCSSYDVHSGRASPRPADRSEDPIRLAPSASCQHTSCDSMAAGIPMSRSQSNRSSVHEEIVSLKGHPMSRSQSNRSVLDDVPIAGSLPNGNDSHMRSDYDAALSSGLDESMGLSDHGARRMAADQMQSPMMHSDQRSMLAEHHQFQQMMMEHQSRQGWSHREANALHEQRRGQHSQEVDWNAAPNRHRQEAKSTMYSSYQPHGQSCMNVPSSLSYEPEQIKSDQLMRDLSAAKPSNQNGDEFMDEIIESLFNDELSAMTHQKDQMSQSSNGQHSMHSQTQIPHGTNQMMHHRRQQQQQPPIRESKLNVERPTAHLQHMPHQFQSQTQSQQHQAPHHQVQHQQSHHHLGMDHSQRQQRAEETSKCQGVAAMQQARQARDQLQQMQEMQNHMQQQQQQLQHQHQQLQQHQHQHQIQQQHYRMQQMQQHSEDVTDFSRQQERHQEKGSRLPTVDKKTDMPRTNIKHEHRLHSSPLSASGYDSQRSDNDLSSGMTQRNVGMTNSESESFGSESRLDANDMEELLMQI